MYIAVIFVHPTDGQMDADARALNIGSLKIRPGQPRNKYYVTHKSRLCLSLYPSKIVNVIAVNILMRLDSRTFFLVKNSREYEHFYNLS